MSELRDYMDRKYRELIDSASDDFKACLSAGVPMESHWDGESVTLTTAEKVAVVRNPDGTTTVYRRKQ